MPTCRTGSTRITCFQQFSVRTRWLMTLACCSSLFVGGCKAQETNDQSLSQSDEQTLQTNTESSPQPQAEVPSEFSKLVISDVRFENGLVLITGETDLPDGAKLSIDFDVAGRDPDETYIGVSEKTTSRNGKFAVSLEPPLRPEFAKGSYLVEAMFTPRGQAEQIIAFVGKDGEKLQGNTVEEVYSFKVMRISERVELDLNLTAYSIESPGEYTQRSPERALANYLVGWQKGDWKGMVKHTQKSWLSMKKDQGYDSSEAISVMYDFKDLLGAKILNTKHVSNVIADIDLRVQYALGADVKTVTMQVRLMRESASLQPSPSGDWGVNPSSTLREN